MRGRWKRYVQQIFTYLLAFFWLVPLLWMIDTAFKPAPEIMTLPPRWIPSHLTLEHLQAVVHKWPFPRWMLNSLIVATSATLLSLVVSTLAAFSFARLRWRGQHFFFLLFLSAMLIPWEVNVIPLYFFMQHFRLLNTYPAIFLPFVAMPIGTFLLRQFFINIPQELEDAARVDGCGSLRVLWHIILPVSRPAFIALAIYMFLFAWNEFFWSLIALQKPEMLTLPIGLKHLQGAYDVNYGLLMSGAFLATLPALFLFVLLQKRIIRGIVLTSGQR